MCALGFVLETYKLRSVDLRHISGLEIFPNKGYIFGKKQRGGRPNSNGGISAKDVMKTPTVCGSLEATPNKMFI